VLCEAFTILQMVVRQLAGPVLGLSAGAFEHLAGIAMAIVDGVKLQGRADMMPGVGDVLAAEHAAILGIRGEANKTAVLPIRTDKSVVGGCHDMIGLALSGGGIRSAAFCTGVLQGLANNDVMPKIDYLSTVSGGGYIGAAVSVSQPWPDDVFPFLPANKDEKVDSEAMRQLRNNANYLKFGKAMQMLINLAIYLRGLVANIVFVAPFVVGLAGLTLFWNKDYDSLRHAELLGLDLPTWFVGFGAFAFSIAGLVATLLIYIAWSIYQSKSAAEELKGKWTWAAALVLPLLGLILFMELQPVLAALLLDTTGSSTRSFSFTLDRIITWFAPLTAIISVVTPFLGNFLKGGESGNGWTAAVQKISSKAVIWLAGLALPLLLWLLYLRLVAEGITYAKVVCPQLPGSALAAYCSLTDTRLFANLTDYAPALACSIVALLLAFVWTFLSPNGNSLHRLYRERLGDAFCIRMNGTTVEARDEVRLSELARQRPYHLINTAINVQNSPKANARGRNADFFLFSPGFIGSEVTGYAKTETVEQVMMDENGVQLDIATAVAISGAAVSSNMGTETIKPMALTLAFLNFRLGYWFPNPNMIGKEKLPRSSISYFIREVFGRLDEESEIVYLTDGGHIENLGIYELLRRRCKVIIAVDAEADPGMTFPALIKLQRYARIDLGARIDLNWSHIADVSLKAQKNEPVQSDGPHCAIGRIEYDNGGIGILFYVKSSVTGDENDYVKDYNRRYRAFPHESTGDQFFSEEQFEVYRSLGFHAIDGALKGKHKVQTSHVELETITGATTKGFGVRQLREILVPAATSSAPKAKRR
jgi:Patatin-like phospholipase